MDDTVDTAQQVRRRHLLAGVSCATLALSYAVSPASAADYEVSNETELRNAITAANADPDATATITLTSSFTVSNTAFPLPTKPMTIDTQSFVLSGIATAPNNPGNIIFSGNFPSGTLTFAGTLVGGASTATIGAATGLSVNNSASSSTGQVVNNGSITGGAGQNAGQTGDSVSH